MPETRLRRDEKLGMILRTAAGVFARKGYHRASIRDISAATGVSLSGLYYYFDSKEELLFLIQDHGFGTVLEDLAARLGEVEEPESRLRVLIDTHLRFFVNNMDEMKVLSHEAESLTGEFRRRVNAKKKRYAEVCASILEELRPAEAGDDARIDARVATFSLFGMMNWIYNWYRPDRDVPVDALAEQMARLFLRGYLSPSDDGTPFRPAEGAAGAAPSIWR